MRTIIHRYPSQMERRIVIGVELDMTASQCNKLIDDAHSQGKVLGVHVMSALIGAGGLYGYMWAKKTGRI
jgi:hypothetical protein